MGEAWDGVLPLGAASARLSEQQNPSAGLWGKRSLIQGLENLFWVVLGAFRDTAWMQRSAFEGVSARCARSEVAPGLACFPSGPFGLSGCTSRLDQENQHLECLGEGGYWWCSVGVIGKWIRFWLARGMEASSFLVPLLGLAEGVGGKHPGRKYILSPPTPTFFFLPEEHPPVGLCWGAAYMLIESSCGLCLFFTWYWLICGVGVVKSEEGGGLLSETLSLRAPWALQKWGRLGLTSELGSSAFLSGPHFAWGSCPTVCPWSACGLLRAGVCAQ